MSESTQPTYGREQFDAYLRSKNKRRTSERFAILQCAQTLGGHFNADQLRQALINTGYHVSIVTVYSTLELLVDSGLVLCHYFDGKCRLYECCATSQPSHHHLICTVCGRIKEMRDSEVDTIINNKHYPSFAQTSFTLNIYGVCRSCQNRRRRASKHW